MRELRYEMVLWCEERDRLTLAGLAYACGVHPMHVERLVELGLVEPCELAGDCALFDVACVPRVRLIERLRRDTGANLQGLAVIMHMLDRTRELQREVEALRARL
jgi:hypothetical protein